MRFKISVAFGPLQLHCCECKSAVVKHFPFSFKGSILVQFQRRVVLHGTGTLVQWIGYRWLKVKDGNKLKENTVASCCHPTLNQISTYRSVKNQSAGTKGDEAVALKKKEKENKKEEKTTTGGAVIGLLLPGSNPIHFPLLCLRHGREILGTIDSLPAGFLLRVSRHCSAGRSTSMPRDYLCFPVSCVRRRRILSEGGSMAAPRSVPHPINPFSTTTGRLSLSLNCVDCTRKNW